MHKAFRFVHYVHLNPFVVVNVVVGVVIIIVIVAVVDANVSRYTHVFIKKAQNNRYIKVEKKNQNKIFGQIQSARKLGTAHYTTHKHLVADKIRTFIISKIA